MRTLWIGLVSFALGAASAGGAVWARHQLASSHERRLSADQVVYALAACAFTNLHSLQSIKDHDSRAAEELLAATLASNLVALDEWKGLVTPLGQAEIDNTLKRTARLDSELDLTTGDAEVDEIVASILRQ